MNLINRLKLAYYAFRLKPCNITIAPYEPILPLKPGFKCDNSWEHRTGCQNEGTVCMTRTIAVLEIKHNDHQHLCEKCANSIRG